MARLVPWRGSSAELAPWRREMMRPWRDIESLFDRFLGEMYRGVSAPLTAVPPLEMRDRKDEIVVALEVPGLLEKDIDISVSDNTLTVKGEKKHEVEEKEEGYSYSELSYGAFERTVTLPAGVKTDNITATCKNGVLEIHIPKAPEAQARHIEVKASPPKK